MLRRKPPEEKPEAVARTATADNGGVAIAGDVSGSTINNFQGVPLEILTELVERAASPEAGDRETLLARLQDLIPENSRLHVEALAGFFRILGSGTSPRTSCKKR